jgi:hypothetical protein
LLCKFSGGFLEGRGERERVLAGCFQVFDSSIPWDGLLVMVLLRGRKKQRNPRKERRKAAALVGKRCALRSILRLFLLLLLLHLLLLLLPLLLQVSNMLLSCISPVWILHFPVSDLEELQSFCVLLLLGVCALSLAGNEKM